MLTTRFVMSKLYRLPHLLDKEVFHSGMVLKFEILLERLLLLPYHY